MDSTDECTIHVFLWTPDKAQTATLEPNEAAICEFGMSWATKNEIEFMPHQSHPGLNRNTSDEIICSPECWKYFTKGQSSEEFEGPRVEEHYAVCERICLLDRHNQRWVIIFGYQAY